MVQGINTAASGMVSVLSQNDIIANNLANTNTPGFKQLIPSFKNIHDAKVYDNSNNGLDNKVIGTLSAGSTLDTALLDFRQGTLRQTGEKLDAALNGDGFFVVEKDSEEYYTRCGNFSLNKDGELITSGGDKVMGENGRSIKIDAETGSLNDITITADGRILNKDQEVDKLKIVDFENKANLNMAGNGLFKNINKDQKPVVLENYEVSQGYIETSNSNVVESLINSITGARTYESLSNVIKNTESTLKLAVTQVGSLN